MKDRWISHNTTFPILMWRVMYGQRYRWSREDAKKKIMPIILWVSQIKNVIITLFTSFYWGYDSPESHV